MGWLKYGEARSKSQQWWSHSVRDHLLHVGTLRLKKYVVQSVSGVVWRSGSEQATDSSQPRTQWCPTPSGAPKAINNSADKTAHLYCIYVAVGVVSQNVLWEWFHVLRCFFLPCFRLGMYMEMYKWPNLGLLVKLLKESSIQDLCLER